MSNVRLFPNIVYMKKSFQAMIYDFLFDWGINMRWRKVQMSKHILQDRKDKGKQNSLNLV